MYIISPSQMHINGTHAYNPVPPPPQAQGLISGSVNDDNFLKFVKKWFVALNTIFSWFCDYQILLLENYE